MFILLNSADAERLYVREVYEKLAVQQSYVDALQDSNDACKRRAIKRLWPNVRKFLRQIPRNSLIIDAGCGQLNYEIEGCFRIGFDICSEALLHSCRSSYHDVVLANCAHLPFRKECADAALCVSVLHHMPSLERRLRILNAIADALTSGGPLLIYVWAAEQLNAQFLAQDVLVPWSLNEIPRKGVTPTILFHKDSTKEQRIIMNSIPVTILDEMNQNDLNGTSAWLKQILWRIRRNMCIIENQILTQYFREKKLKSITKLLPVLNRLIGNRIRLAIPSVEELYANELSATLVDEALSIALNKLQEITYYRYYHVFRSGELEALLSKCPTLTAQSAQYDSANWYVIVKKQSDIISKTNYYE